MKEATNIIKKYKFDDYELKKNFDKAYEDDDFRKIVNDIDMPNEKLISYTSLIMDSAKEFKNCKNCKNILECRNAVNGHVYYPSVLNDEIVFSYIPCKYKKKLDKDTEYQNNIIMIDMPREILNASMKNIYTDDKNRIEAIKWLTTFIKKCEAGTKTKGLYLTGNFGCGKTYLVAASMNELAKKGKKVAIVYYPDFLRKLKESFSDDFKTIFNDVKNSEILLLDDIGAETVTSWNRDEILGTILQYRMQEGLPTLFTSNLTISELEVHLASNDSEGRIKARRIIERIKFLTDNITMIAENRRKWGIKMENNYKERTFEDNGGKSRVVIESDNAPLNMPSNVTLINRPKVKKKVKTNPLLQDIGPKSQGFAGVALLAGLIALAGVALAYFNLRY